MYPPESLTYPDDVQFRFFEELLVKAIRTMTGVKLTQMPERERKLDHNKQEFLKAFTFFFRSISILNNGIMVVGDNKPDTVSAMPVMETLVRSCLENYSLFYYIYLDDADPAIVYFRFWSWYREGLIFRQSYKTRYPEHVKKLAEDLIEIKRIRDSLVSNPCYKALSPNQQKEYDNKGLWLWTPGGQKISKAELISRCGFSSFAFTFYTHLCGFSHTSSISLIQTWQADFNTAQKLSSTTMKALFMMAGFYLRSYTQLFPTLNTAFDSKDKRFYQDWCNLGEVFTANY